MPMAMPVQWFAVMPMAMPALVATVVWPAVGAKRQRDNAGVSGRGPVGHDQAGWLPASTSRSRSSRSRPLP